MYYCSSCSNINGIQKERKNQIIVTIIVLMIIVIIIKCWRSNNYI